jgi:hypothetical protein
MVDLSYT